MRFSGLADTYPALSSSCFCSRLEELTLNTTLTTYANTSSSLAVRGILIAWNYDIDCNEYVRCTAWWLFSDDSPLVSRTSARIGATTSTVSIYSPPLCAWNLIARMNRQRRQLGGHRGAQCRKPRGIGLQEPEPMQLHLQGS